MKVMYKKMGYLYIVKHKSSYYLVDTKRNKYEQAKYIDEFLRFGYFTEAKEITPKEIEKLADILGVRT